MSQEPEMTEIICHLIWKTKHKIALWNDEQQILDDYTNKLMIAFILNARFTGDVTKHREMEKTLLSIFGRMEFWKKKVAMTDVLKITGVIQEEKPAW